MERQENPEQAPFALRWLHHEGIPPLTPGSFLLTSEVPSYRQVSRRVAVTAWLHSSSFLYAHLICNDLLKTRFPVDFKPYKGRDRLVSCSILRTVHRAWHLGGAQ